MARRAYPDFGVPPGYLTEDGRQAENLLGGYYRQYLLHEHLLTGNVNEMLRSRIFAPIPSNSPTSPPPNSGRDYLTALKNAIGSQLVEDLAREVPRGVLTSVPVN